MMAFQNPIAKTAPQQCSGWLFFPRFRHTPTPPHTHCLKHSHAHSRTHSHAAQQTHTAHTITADNSATTKSASRPSPFPPPLPSPLTNSLAQHPAPHSRSHACSVRPPFPLRGLGVCSSMSVEDDVVWTSCCNAGVKTRLWRCSNALVVRLRRGS